ncbi:RNA polymerase sigma-I factor [Herbivorax sp. ANBcel31]|uniref:RNA polymerase sigma-I factor n=1 Tax=Herbivorax sp. ANBcel31 TaxID=3069754 RepID=UPI0027B48762|nr:RNA polymerase sigma-I factor [Herbivorax sp. ANBcel31]MDQ2086386.1 RNA polymerase sigma-I factor [Herbivorax sp. ANBcel31]
MGFILYWYMYFSRRGGMVIIVFTVYNSDGESVAQIIEKIKDGDKEVRENFIKDYIPFILKVLSKDIPETSNIKNCDEYSIGLIAFNEAIEKYDSRKCSTGFNFFSFAEQVIKRRIIDYFRFKSKSRYELPFSYLENDERSYEEKYLKDETGSKFDRIELFQEIKHYNRKLEAFGMKISDMPKYMPKHRDSRKMCVDIARKIVQNKEIYHKLINKKYLPIKELTKIVDFHPRTLQRNRNYIISICLIYGNDYEHLKSYLGNPVK